MGKIAFVFSGQGAQKVGMGKSLYDSSDVARSLFDAAEVVRPGTLDLCFNGSDADLMQTKNTQPCLYLCDLAAALTLDSLGVRAARVAGFSLGELPALAYSGAYGHIDGFKLAVGRGLAMQSAAEENPASMAAVLKLSDDAVVEICERVGDAWAVNFNCPGQVAVAYLADKGAELASAVKDAGGKLLPLKVSGGFHSPLMESSANEFAKLLAEVDVAQPKIPTYSDVTAELYGAEVRDLLKMQIHSPVRWTNIIRDMAASGVDTFIECGVGKTLCGLIAKTLTDAKVYAVSDIDEANEVAKNVKE